MVRGIDRGANVAAKDEKAGEGEGAAEGEKSKRCFVITPIGAENSPERLHADWVLNIAIKPVFEDAGYTVFRSDTIDDPSMINDAIFNHIFEDDVCVADLSFTNANVYYELGVRHSLLKPVIHISHNLVERLPFDNQQHRAIFFTLNDYHSVERLKVSLRAQLATIESEGFKVSNPITHARGRIEIAKSGDDKDKLISELLSRMDSMERQFRSGGTMSNIDRYVRDAASGSRLRGDVRRIRNGIPHVYSDTTDYLIDVADDVVRFFMAYPKLSDDEFSQQFYRTFGDIVVDFSMDERHVLVERVIAMHRKLPKAHLLEPLISQITKPSA